MKRGADFDPFKENFIEIEKIQRVLRMEQIGNFQPIFCIYKSLRCLVKSLEGDISDPFRREESYLNKLYIDIDKEE